MPDTRPGPTPHVNPTVPTLPESDAARARRWRRTFLSYYRPYRRVLLLDLACAFLVAGIAVAFPLVVRFITGEVLGGPLGAHELAPESHGWALGAPGAGLHACVCTACPADPGPASIWSSGSNMRSRRTGASPIAA